MSLGTGARAERARRRRARTADAGTGSSAHRTSGDAPERPTGPSVPPAEPPGGARAWLVWGVGVSVYFLAMFHRNGLGVAALEAQERFSVGPALLAVLPMLQLLVYVLLQVPAGLLADRVGPRRSLLMGLLAMALGVALFAVAPNVQAAIAGRLLIGVGDAVTFLNVIRLAALWFRRSDYALISALTGVIGGLGQVASVAPLSAALNTMGWTPAFLASGGLTVLMALLVALVVRDRPDGAVTASVHPRISVWASIAEAMRARGPRIAMAHHAAVMAPYTMLAVLWGYPFLVGGMGLSPGRAALLLTVLGIGTLWLSPLLGAIAGRAPGIRRPFASCYTVVLSLGWCALALWPGGLPAPLVVAVLVVSAAGAVIAPALSFDFARDGVPAHRTGVSSGLVNMSGFATAVLGMMSAGLILETTPEPHGMADFQLAFLPITATTVLATAVLLFLLWRRPRSAPAG